MNVDAKYKEVLQGISLITKLKARRDFNTAVKLCGDLLLLEPTNQSLHFLEGDLHEEAGNIDAAIERYNRCLKLSAQHFPATLGLARCHAKLENYVEAIDHIKAALELEPNNLELHGIAGRTYNSIRHYEKAIHHDSVVVKQQPHYLVYQGLGRAYFRSDRIEEAIGAYEKAIEYGGARSKNRASIARVLASQGKVDQALSQLNMAMRQDPSHSFSYLQFAAYLADRVDIDQLYEKAVKFCPLDHSSQAIDSRDVPMLFAYAKMLEAKGRHDEAFAYYHKANCVLHEEFPHCSDAEQLALSNAIRRHEHENSGPLPCADDGGQELAFVFGLPRSGTSLTEQILSSHPAVQGIGEHEAYHWIDKYMHQARADELSSLAQYYMDSLPKRTGDTRLFVDKSMSTYGFVGSILRLFPNARFVQCVRHPMEAAWSMYSTLFQTGQLQFTTDFAGLAQKYEIYENFMTLWDRLYPDRILHLYYDELINDPEVEIRRILSHLGLEWDPACLDFHTTKNTVRTASITQVRQPLYKTASQKWRSYEAHLEPLQTLLAPFIDRYQRRCFARAKTDTA